MTSIPEGKLKRTPPKAEFTTSRAGLLFHVALVMVPIFLVSVPVVVGLAFYNWKKPEAHEEHALWTRRLWALSACDVVMLGLVLLLSPDPMAAPPAGLGDLFFAELIWTDLIPLPVFLSVWAFAAFRKHAQWKVWATLIGVLLLAMLVVPFSVQQLAEWIEGKSTERHVVIALTAQVVVLLGLGYLWWRKDGSQLKWGHRYGLRPGRTYVLALIYLLGALGRLVPLLLLVEGLLAWAGPEAPVEALVEDVGTSADWVSSILLFVSVGIIGPIAEEFCFRGVLLPRLGQWAKPSVAIAMTSIAFASLHSFYGVRVLGIVVIGAVLGWARYRSRNLKAPILLHITINNAAIAGLLMQP